MRQIWMRFSTGLATIACAGLLGMTAAPVEAQQRLIPIPAKAQRADITFNGSTEVLIDGKVARLAPGVRIFGPNNLLQMSGALNGTAKAKFLLEETTGNVLTVWILTEEEIATPDPKQ